MGLFICFLRCKRLYVLVCEAELRSSLVCEQFSISLFLNCKATLFLN
uniref:Uncharacterized protein n=1 Tax=Rhizophora mucronata TaxID=61149 RepID=A0A2P2NL29_RHIMU